MKICFLIAVHIIWPVNFMEESNMKIKESHYQGHDGTRMLVRAWAPDEESKASIVAIHGLGAHSGLLSNLGEFFSSKGFTFYAPDMRGFGTFPGRKGHVESFDEYIEDMKFLIDDIKDKSSGKRVFLFGHSLGGLHVIRYVSSNPGQVDGVILMCPGISERLKVSNATKKLVGFLSKLNLKVYFNNGLDFTLLAKNPEIPQRYQEDPLRFDKVTPRFASEGFKASAEGASLAPSIRDPVLVIQTGEDKIIIPEKTKEFFDNISSLDKTYKFYPDLYHEPFEDDGVDELLNDIYVWIEERIQPTELSE